GADHAREDDDWAIRVRPRGVAAAQSGGIPERGPCRVVHSRRPERRLATGLVRRRPPGEHHHAAGSRLPGGAGAVKTGWALRRPGGKIVAGGWLLGGAGWVAAAIDS